MSIPPNERALPLSLIWNQEEQTAPVLESTKPGASDEDLMGRLQSQDYNALDLIFTRYSRLVFAIGLRILRDRHECEDVVQEVFFYIYQKSSLYDPAKGSARAWIVQVAFSRALDRRSHLARRALYSGTDLDALSDTLAGTIDIEQAVEARLNRSHLERAFEELPPAQRRTIEMFYFEGLTLREISERLDESLGTVRHHFYRGLERLRKSTFLRNMRDIYR